MNAHAHVLATPIGPLTVVAADGVVVAVRFAAPDGSAALQPGDGPATTDPEVPVEPVLAAAVDQLHEYFNGARQEFDLPLEPTGTVFQRRCWAALVELPYATTTTYARQADRLGDPRAVRAVGAANGRNPIPVIIPCHRVIGADGRLVGFGGGLAAKAWLLDHEQRTAGAQLPL